MRNGGVSEDIGERTRVQGDGLASDTRGTPSLELVGVDINVRF